MLPSGFVLRVQHKPRALYESLGEARVYARAVEAADLAVTDAVIDT